MRQPVLNQPLCSVGVAGEATLFQLRLTMTGTMASLSSVSIRSLLCVGLLASSALAGAADHTYNKGEHVELWVNKVGRMGVHNPMTIRILVGLGTKCTRNF